MLPLRAPRRTPGGPNVRRAFSRAGLSSAKPASWQRFSSAAAPTRMPTRATASCATRRHRRAGRAAAPRTRASAGRPSDRRRARLRPPGARPGRPRRAARTSRKRTARRRAGRSGTRTGSRTSAGALRASLRAHRRTAPPTRAATSRTSCRPRSHADRRATRGRSLCRGAVGTAIAQLSLRGQPSEGCMGLGGVWKRVRGTFEERPHNLLAISDLHLGCDLKPGARPARRGFDAQLAGFLDYHGSNRTNGKPWRLILDGDIVDFVAITVTPGPGEAGFEISEEERQFGLGSEEAKCVWKLRQTFARHPEVFDALARFLQKGNFVHIVRGNHDGEFHWYAVQSGFFDPASVSHALDLPISSKVLRYFANRYAEQTDLDEVDTWGVPEYIDWVLKAGNPLRIAADYFVMVWRVTYPVFVQSLKAWRRFARAADKAISRVDAHASSAHLRKALGRFSGTEAQARQLLAIASRPAEESLFDSMQLFYLDRAVLAVLGLLGAFVLVGAAHGLWAKLAAAVATGIGFAALNAVLARRRRTDAHPMLQQAARRVAQLFDVKYVVMGHSHRVVDEPIGSGARYLNLGSWTNARIGFPHVVVEDGVAELRYWKNGMAEAREEQQPPQPAPLPIPA